jgi:hypothetical protein
MDEPQTTVSYRQRTLAHRITCDGTRAHTQAARRRIKRALASPRVHPTGYGT